MKCDRCKKKAVMNVQMNIYEEHYRVDADNGDYQKTSSEFIDSDENHHFCKEHYDKFCNGDKTW